MVPLYSRVIKNVINYTHEDVRRDMVWHGPIRSVKSTVEKTGLEMEVARVS